MNRRRTLLVIGGLCACALGPYAGGQTRQHRVGFLASTPPDGYRRLLDELLAGLKANGYAEGRNLIIEQRWTSGATAPLESLAGELAKIPVDVIVAWATPATAAARKATSRVPIIMVSIADPVGAKFVQTLSRPGGNITGVSNISAELSGKMLSVLREISPGATRIGVLRNSANPVSRLQLRDAEQAAKSLGMELHVVEASEIGDLERAFATLKSQRVEGAIALADPTFIIRREQIARLALRDRVPTVFARSENVEAGGLISYGPDLREQFRLAAGYVHRVLQGATPGELPVAQPTKVELVVNLKTARALGISIPQPVLVRADRVIE